MSTVPETRQRVMTDLVGAGIRTYDDPRRVAPPCALVVRQRASFNSNCNGDGETEWAVYLLAGGAGNADAVKQLDDMEAKAHKAMRFNSATTTSYQVDDGPAIPSVELNWTEQNSW